MAARRNAGGLRTPVTTSCTRTPFYTQCDFPAVREPRSNPAKGDAIRVAAFELAPDALSVLGHMYSGGSWQETRYPAPIVAELHRRRLVSAKTMFRGAPRELSITSKGREVYEHAVAASRLPGAQRINPGDSPQRLTADVAPYRGAGLMTKEEYATHLAVLRRIAAAEAKGRPVFTGGILDWEPHEYEAAMALVRGRVVASVRGGLGDELRLTDLGRAYLEQREEAPRKNPAKGRSNPAGPRRGRAAAPRANRSAAGAMADPLFEPGPKRKREPCRDNPRVTVVRPKDGSTINHVTGAQLAELGIVNLGTLAITLADGRTVRGNRSAADVSLLTPTISKVKRVPLRRGGRWNKKVRRALKGKAGVYVVWVGKEARARYVGASAGGKNDPDRMMRTILRHFQCGFTPEKYAAKTEVAPAYAEKFSRAQRYLAGGREWTYHGREDLDVAIYVTEPTKAYHHEGRFILELEPSENDLVPFTGEQLDAESEVPF